MLEKYSKSKAYMYVRKKKAGRAAKKKKSKSPFSLNELSDFETDDLRTASTDTEGDENGEDGLGMGEDEEEEEIARGTVSFGEHSFQFEKFEQVCRSLIE